MAYTQQEITDSQYGYLPNLPVNSIGLALCLILFICQTFLGWRYKQWWFMSTWDIGLGCLIVGWAVRVNANTNINCAECYQTQYSLFIFAPVFIMAGVYAQMSRLVKVYGTQFAQFRPKFYTIFFICCDVVSLLLQGAGGGIASGGGTSYQTGINLILGGIAFQVVSMCVFLFCLSFFLWKVYKASPAEYSPLSRNIRSHPTFRWFIVAIYSCWVFVMVRSIYRLIELSQGWGGALAKDEPAFFVLEGLMMILAVVSLTILYPGFYFTRTDKVLPSDYNEAASLETESIKLSYMP